MSARWIDEIDDRALEEALRQRPSGKAAPTDEDRYHDAEASVGDDELAPPWLDRSEHREAEL